MRRYEVAHLTPDGDILDFHRIAPALPIFEEAFSGFARGSLIQTETGPVAIEDLLPGTPIRLADGGYLPLVWKGSMMLIPGAPGQDPGQTRLTRIAADTLGFSRPANDVVLGPSARLFHRSSAIRTMTGRDGAFIPAADFVDGGSVVAITPISAIEVFHLCLDRHARILAGGLEVETYHPGSNTRFTLRGEMLNLFLSLFPQITSLEDFGLTPYARLNLQDLDLLNIA